VRIALLVAVLLLAGCGGSDGGGGSERPTIDPATALGMNGDEVTVRGYFSREPGTILPRMCTALAESYPPRCGMPSLPISNLTDETPRRAGAGQRPSSSSADASRTAAS
jgi:hypothetical protein